MPSRGLTDTERELVSVGASVAAGCALCTDVHVRDARRAGVMDDEIERAMSVALEVREEATRIMQRHGLKALGRKLLGLAETDTQTENAANEELARIDVLVGAAAAYAVNCDSILERYRAAGSGLGITDEELRASLRLSKFIKGKAESLCCKWL